MREATPPMNTVASAVRYLSMGEFASLVIRALVGAGDRREFTYDPEESRLVVSDGGRTGHVYLSNLYREYLGSHTPAGRGDARDVAAASVPSVRIRHRFGRTPAVRQR